MATYAIGDIQGCFSAFQCLLNEVKFDPNQDRLWVAGDMVNRGPQSLETLRFIKHLGDSATVVLGNHDLHLLAVASGSRKKNAKDTLDAVLLAPDREELLTWLLSQELIHYDIELDTLMVHAGLPPIWSVDQALALASEVTSVLRNGGSHAFFNHMYGNQPDQWHEDLKGIARLRLITNYFTRMRICTPEGRLELKHKSGTDNLPNGYQPWFTYPTHRPGNTRILFGHWAALEGKTDSPHVIALDTGCVWGGKLTLYRLEDKRFFHCKCSTF